MGPSEFSAILRHIGNLFTHKIASATTELNTVVTLATRLLETAKMCMTGQSSGSHIVDDAHAGQTTVARFQDALRLCGCVVALKSFAIKLDKNTLAESGSSVTTEELEAKIDKLIAGVAALFADVLPNVSLVGGHAVPGSAEVFSRTVRSQFASMPSSYWTEGKAAAKELADLVPGASIPTSAEGWYELMASPSSSEGAGEGAAGDESGGAQELSLIHI
eukprot:TRINITY_DN8606_c0_g1_i2.p1 TRINITY_DN8606_c0_g1~~TRINITY_DN8606_c0_g1_i2.p1  ORF type:complete len:219 (-),score=58.44 TRINITY_DN8606_c0_g1_i2:171-827(-)